MRKIINVPAEKEMSTFPSWSVTKVKIEDMGYEFVYEREKDSLIPKDFDIQSLPDLNGSFAIFLKPVWQTCPSDEMSRAIIKALFERLQSIEELRMLSDKGYLNHADQFKEGFAYLRKAEKATLDEILTEDGCRFGLNERELLFFKKTGFIIGPTEIIPFARENMEKILRSF